MPKQNQQSWTFLTDVRDTFYLAGPQPAMVLLLSRVIETIVRAGASFWRAAFVDALDWATITVAGGWCITLALNVHYLRGSNYLRALGEQVGGYVLLAMFAAMSFLTLLAFFARKSRRVQERCSGEDIRHKRYCWGVYGVQLAARLTCIFGWVFWVTENQQSLNLYHPGNFAPLTVFMAGAAAVSFLVAVSLPAPGRHLPPAPPGPPPHAAREIT